MATLEELEERIKALEQAQNPTEYYTSKYSGEEIDVILGEHSGATIADSVTQKTYRLIIESGVLKLQEA